MPRTGPLLALGLALLLGGCAQIVTRAVPKANVGQYHHIFVEHRLADAYGVADEVARQLRAMGYDASAGALTMMPPETEVILSYDDMWQADFSTYLIEFDLQVRTARGDKILAVGHYYRPSMILGHPPTAMIHELLVKVFKHA